MRLVIIDHSTYCSPRMMSRVLKIYFACALLVFGDVDQNG